MRLFPGTTQAQHPDLLLAKAWTLETGRTDSQTILGTIGQAQALVDRMTGQPERARQLQGEIDALCSLEKGLAAANAHSTIELATRALETMPREWYLARAEAWLYLALSLQTVGQLDRAYTVLATGQKEEMAESGSPRARIAGSSAFLHWIAADLSSLLQSAHSSSTLARRKTCTILSAGGIIYWLLPSTSATTWKLPSGMQTPCKTNAM